MSAIETFEFEHGIVGKLEYDEDCESPYDSDNAVKIVLLHRRYNNPSPEVGSTPDEVAEWVKENSRDWFVTNLFMYEHSGVALRAGERNPFSCPWDSGQVGIVAIEKAIWGRGKGERNAKRLEWCKNVAETYGMWMNGECYGYVIEDEDGRTLESCFGYVGTEDCISELKSSGEHYVKARAEEIAEEEANERALADAENNHGAGI